MFTSCLEKQKKIQLLFPSSLTKEERYQKIIELGKANPQLDPQHKVAENLVEGCQSATYLRSFVIDGKIFFEAESDAFIAAGLAALLTQVYSGEAPEVVLKCPPDYLEEMGIATSLTPNRANGLYSMHLRMKKEALAALISH